LNHCPNFNTYLLQHFSLFFRIPDRLMCTSSTILPAHLSPLKLPSHDLLDMIIGFCSFYCKEYFQYDM
jgi:hypothetical protein